MQTLENHILKATLQSILHSCFFNRKLENSNLISCFGDEHFRLQSQNCSVYLNIRNQFGKWLAIQFLCLFKNEVEYITVTFFGCVLLIIKTYKNLSKHYDFCLLWCS